MSQTTMIDFKKDQHGWCEYFTVIQPEQGFPYGRDGWGVAGPFADEAEARQAREIIAAKQPAELKIMRCSFDTDCDGYLFEEMGQLQEEARAAIARQAKQVATQ
jgi:hypothetical protein